MESHGTHLVQNRESRSRTNESQLKKEKQGPSCNQTVYLKTDLKTLYYSV